MRYFLIILLCFTANAQTSEFALDSQMFEFQDVCGDPRKSSDGSMVLEGKVVKIIDGNTISVKVEGKQKVVDLVAVNTGSNKTDAKNFLSGKILGQEVELLVLASDYFEKKRIYAVVKLNEVDVNRSMIENGIGHYDKPKPYKVPSYTACVYYQLGKKAKEMNLGIWAK